MELLENIQSRENQRYFNVSKTLYGYLRSGKINIFLFQAGGGVFSRNSLIQTLDVTTALTASGTLTVTGVLQLNAVAQQHDF